MLSDSNGDDMVNEIDYSGVASYIMGDTPAEFDAEASDVDVNGTADVRDCMLFPRAWNRTFLSSLDLNHVG